VISHRSQIAHSTPIIILQQQFPLPSQVLVLKVHKPQPPLHSKLRLLLLLSLPQLF
jgi:hypothetical protein